MAQRRRRLFGRLRPSTDRILKDLLRDERLGGVLMLAATLFALVWANSPLSSAYFTLQDVRPIDTTVMLPGGGSFHLNLTVAQWAADGLLAIFFLVVGLELKRELVCGELRKPSTAVVPIVAALGGIVVPVAIYLVVNGIGEDGSVQGWAIPTATDIAFALAILSVFGRRLPGTLRAFLLTLAVVDDLVAIVIIAVFYSEDLHFAWLVPAVLALWGINRLSRRRTSFTWLAVPLGGIVWLCIHEAGIHATIAGVAIGLVVSARRKPGEYGAPVEKWEHRWNPVSALIAVPLFAFLAAGVALDGEALGVVVGDPISRGVFFGLIVGKPVGIVLATFLIAGLTRASLPRGVSWWDITGLSVVAGVGFTVSLLVGELAFGLGSPEAEHAKVAVLIASVVSATGGSLLLSWRDRRYGRIETRSG